MSHIQNPTLLLSSLIATGLALSVFPAKAGNHFNPAFLAEDPAAIADLSYFSRGNVLKPGDYPVKVIFNGEQDETRSITFVDRDGKVQPCISLRLLNTLGVNTAAFPALSQLKTDCVDIERIIPDASVSYALEKNSLTISVPQAALKFKARGYIAPEYWDHGINAGLLNYAFSGDNSRGESSSSNYFLNLRGGINMGDWRLRDYATWRHSKKGADWNHINTYLQRDITRWKSKLTLGDSFTNADVFDSFNYRGIGIASDDAMLPDSQRGFAPVIHGVAHSHARVTIRQNGYEIYQTYVSPGPFTIRDLYPTSNSGDLQVSVEEADGSMNRYSVPYAGVPILQRRGHYKYSLNVGELKSNYHQRKPKVAQGTLIVGLPADTTLYGGSQFTDDYRAWSLGVGKNLGDLGALSLDAAQSTTRLPGSHPAQGYATRFLYAKSLNDLGTSVQLSGYRYLSPGFYTLNESVNARMAGFLPPHEHDGSQGYFAASNKRKASLQLNLSQNLGDIGSLFVTASRQTYWQTAGKSTLLQTGYNGSLGGISYNVMYSYNRSPGVHASDRTLSLGLSVPLQWLMAGNTRYSNSSYMTYNVSQNSEGITSHNLGVAGTLLQGNTLNYSLQQSMISQDPHYSGNAALGYQGRNGNMDVGYNYQQDKQQVNYTFSGGVLAHRDGITLAQPLSANMILVDAKGAPNVRVDNATGVYTDANGFAVIPYAAAYRQNRVALDTSTLGDNIDLDENIRYAVPTQGAISRVKFTPRIGNRVLLTVRHHGKAIPFGAIAADKKNDLSGIVGDDGVLYLAGVPESGEVTLTWGRGQQQTCRASYHLPGAETGQPFIKLNLECQ